MRLSSIPAIAAALFFLLPCLATAQEAPEAVYGKFHQALLKGDFDEIKKHATAESMSEMAKMPADQRMGMLAFAAMLLPQEYTITGKVPSPDGNRFTIRATAKLPTLPGAKPEQAIGEIQMLKQGGAWKVHQSNWKNADPSIDAGRPTSTVKPAPKAEAQSAPERRPAPAKATSPQAPAPVVGTPRQPCEYKPVMSDEDMERCR